MSLPVKYKTCELIMVFKSFAIEYSDTQPCDVSFFVDNIAPVIYVYYLQDGIGLAFPE